MDWEWGQAMSKNGLGMSSGWEQSWTGYELGLGAKLDWVWGQAGSKAGIVATTYNVPAEYGVSASYPQLGCH